MCIFIYPIDQLQPIPIPFLLIILPGNDLAKPKDPLQLDLLKLIVHAQEGLQRLQVGLQVVCVAAVDGFDEDFGYFPREGVGVTAHVCQALAELLGTRSKA